MSIKYKILKEEYPTFKMYLEGTDIKSEIDLLANTQMYRKALRIKYKMWELEGKDSIILDYTVTLAMWRLYNEEKAKA
jgi:hypothetical protein